MIVHDDANAIALVHLNRRARSAAVVTPEINHPARKYLLFNRLGNEMEFLNAPVHVPRKLGHVRRFHGNHPTVAAHGCMVHVLHVHARCVRLRRCKQTRCGCETGAHAQTIFQEITSVLHSRSSLRLGGPNCLQQLNGHWIEERCTAKQSTRSRCCGYTVAKRRGETQMRRMEKDAACSGGEAGGPLSKPHAAVKSGARNSAVVLRTTVLLRTTVT